MMKPWSSRFSHLMPAVSLVHRKAVELSRSPYWRVRASAPKVLSPPQTNSGLPVTLTLMPWPNPV